MSTELPPLTHLLHNCDTAWRCGAYTIYAFDNSFKLVLRAETKARSRISTTTFTTLEEATRCAWKLADDVIYEGRVKNRPDMNYRVIKSRSGLDAPLQVNYSFEPEIAKIDITEAEARQLVRNELNHRVEGCFEFSEAVETKS